MALELNLEDAWAKLSRGREHAAELRRKIETAGAPDYRNVSLRREFDPESSCIIIVSRGHWKSKIVGAYCNSRRRYSQFSLFARLPGLATGD